MVGSMITMIPAASFCHDPCWALAKFIRNVVNVLSLFFGIYRYGIYISLIMVMALMIITVAVAGAKSVMIISVNNTK